MRILFFSYLSYDDDRYKGGGWVNALIDLLSQKENYTVGVAYVTALSAEKRCQNGVTYYPIYHKPSVFRKVCLCLARKQDVIIEKETVDQIIEDFKPDIIQLFGLETPFGSIVNHVTRIPVVVHIQGICAAVYDKWFPMGFSKFSVWWYSPLKEKLLCRTSSDVYRRFVGLARTEEANYRRYHYYLGRTAWDYAVSRVLAPDSTYYHCDEVLRSEFYGKSWHWQQHEQVVLSTTMNGELYKGFDTILRTACLLKGMGVHFRWDVYGVDESFPLRRAVEKTVGESFSKNFVHFRGKKNAQELVDALLGTTFYVHPSHIENSPNSVCEAMLLGVPCIVMNVGGVSSLYEDKKSGFLVPEPEPYMIASIVANHHNDAAFLQEISRNAQAIAKERHDGRRIIEQLVHAYESILSVGTL